MKFRTINEAKNYNKEIVKAKIVHTEGSVPREKGDLMLINSSDIFGSIGGGHLEFIVINKAKNFLKNRIQKKEIINIPLGPGIGQCCGGYVQIELSYHDNGKLSLGNEKLHNLKNDSLFIFGAGHIGQALTKKTLNLNFDIHLVDSRKEFLFINEHEDIKYIFAVNPWELIKNLPQNSYFLVLTHSHDYDFKIINELLFFNSFKFIGLIGSKTKKNRFINRLINNGHNKDLIDQIECPVGLNIKHTKDPNEIAISIIARLIDYRNNLAIKDSNYKKKING